MTPQRSAELLTPAQIRACLSATEPLNGPSGAPRPAPNEDGHTLPDGAGALVVGPLLGAMLWAFGAACWAAWPSLHECLMAAWGMR